MVDAFTPDAIPTYFFSNFSCIMVKLSADQTDFWKSDHPDEFWKSVILGCFYVFATFGYGNLTACRLNQTIQDVVPMCATQGMYSPVQPHRGAKSHFQVSSTCIGPRKWCWSPLGPSIPPLRAKIRLSKFGLQFGVRSKYSKYSAMGKTGLRADWDRQGSRETKRPHRASRCLHLWVS